jgi:hypothetical protein
MYNNEEKIKLIFNNFFDELKKDIKRKGNLWTPTLITSYHDGRTVVLRGFQQGKRPLEDLIIHTDIRSKKWKDLEDHPLASLHFYCRKRKWQMRIKGLVKRNTQDIDAKIEWDRLSSSSKKIYSLKHIPGTPISSAEEGFTFSRDDAQQDIEIAKGYENFGVLTIEPTYLESLQLSHPLRDDMHVRAMWDLVSDEKSFLAP